MVGRINKNIEISLHAYDVIRDKVTTGHDAMINNIENVHSPMSKQRTQ